MRNGRPFLLDLIDIGNVIYKIHLERNAKLPKRFNLENIPKNLLLPKTDDFNELSSQQPNEIIEPIDYQPKKLVRYPIIISRVQL